MTTTSMRVRTTLAGVVVGAAAVFGLVAVPAGAQTSGPGTSGGALATDDSVASGTCVAIDNSVCSGSGSAIDDSTSSGAAHARDDSVSSGCATAIDDSTASGANCPRRVPPTTDRHGDKGDKGDKGTGGSRGAVGGGTTARPATATAGRSLALTGSSTGKLAGLAGLALASGGALVLVSRRRPAGS